MHYLLFYEVADDYVARRAPYREEHLKRGWAAAQRGELLLGGALANPVDGAVLLFQGDSPAVAENFAKADPYVTSGAVKRWYVREWNTVAGEGAANPVVPEGVTRPRTGVLRMWRGRATPERAHEYAYHAATRVFPKLKQIDGYRGAQLLRRKVNGVVEFMVLTFWESMAAVSRFAGAEPDRAVVEPEAQAVLSDFDETVSHFEVVESQLPR